NPFGPSPPPTPKCSTPGRRKRRAERVRTGMSFGERLIEGDRCKRVDDRIRPAVIDEQFPTMRLERIDVGDRRAVHVGSEYGVCFRHIVIKVETAPIPARPEHPFEDAVEAGLLERQGRVALLKRPAEGGSL